MRRIVITLEYDGTDFLGWQLQPQVRTVQGVVEDAVRRATDAEKRVVVHGSGRTDTGVHAAGQVAHFDTDSDLAASTLVRAVNHWLPDDVSILGARETNREFHARFSASKKLYRYRILLSPVPRPLRNRFACRVFEQMAVGRMKTCARRLLGTHDFASFTSSGSGVRSTVRRIFRSEWDEQEDELLYFVEGNGFTYNMVRALVGTMLEVGRGKIDVRDFEEIMRARDRSAAGPTAEARGLMLVRVDYQSPVSSST